MIVTKIEQGKKRADRANIYLDEEYVFSLSLDLVLENGLHNGLELSQDQIDRMVVADALIKAYDRAVRFLGYRKRSVKEVRDKLQQLEYSEAAIAAVVEKLERLGYLNDYDFAETWVRDRLNLKPTAKKVIRLELKQKGISEEIISMVLSDIDPQTETAQAIRLVEKKGFSALSGQARDQKIKNFLLRKGFGWETVKAVLDSL